MKEDKSWTGFSLEPDKEDDYEERLDMVAAVSIYPEMWKSAHDGLPFDSVRFSKTGEKFCYLKIDGESGKPQTPEQRDKLAQALDKALREAKVGCTMGGAGGLRYSYIDLALTDILAAAQILKDICKEQAIGQRAWLLFFDDELEREWIGMTDSTTPPYMVNHE